MRLKGWARGIGNENLQKQKCVKGGRENEMSIFRVGQAVTDGLGDALNQNCHSMSMEMWYAVWRTTLEWNENRNGFVWSQRLTEMKGLASSTLTIFDAAVAW